MTVVDEAVERFQATGDEYGAGLTNHGPMVVDAPADEIVNVALLLRPAPLT